MGYPRIDYKILEYLKQHPNRDIPTMRIAKTLKASTSGVLHATRNLSNQDPLIQFTSTKRPFLVRYNDPQAAAEKEKQAATKAAQRQNGKIEIGMTLVIGGQSLTLSETEARALYDKLKHMFGA